MAAKVYECMFIFNANAYARNPGALGNSIKEMVEAVGGELLANRMWNEQKLAFPINGQRKGVYWLSYARLATDTLSKLNRACQLNESIIRFMIVAVDPRLVDTLVAAANDTNRSTRAAAEVETATEATGEGESETAETQDEAAAVAD